MMSAQNFSDKIFSARRPELENVTRNDKVAAVLVTNMLN